MSKTFLWDTNKGDLFINPSGKSYLIEDEAKLKQDLVETILTKYDSLRNYGNSIQVGDFSSNSTLANESYIELGINDAIERLMNYQQSDIYLTAKEEILAIEEITSSSLSKTKFSYFIKIRNGENEVISGNISSNN